MGTRMMRRSRRQHNRRGFVPAVFVLSILLHVPCFAQRPLLQKLDPPPEGNWAKPWS